jgi:hypothetical protein
MLLAKLLLATGKDAEALVLLQRAYRIAHMSDGQMTNWGVPNELMQFYRAGKSPQPEVAIFYGKEAVNNLQRLRGSMSGAGNEAQEAFVKAAWRRRSRFSRCSRSRSSTTLQSAARTPIHARPRPR